MKKKIIFAVILAAIAIGLMQIPFTNLVGSSAKFNLFDFYGPIVGSLVGSLTGFFVILTAQLVNWGTHGFSLDAGVIIRLFPMFFAMLYFARRSRLMLIVPVAAMAAFWLHPEGQMAWYYALYWLIPIAMYWLRDKFVFARALGATFTAHAVGGALWIWIFNMKSILWIGLIPIVWKERGLMALGITTSYWAMSYLLRKLSQKNWMPALALKPHHSVNK